MDLGIDSRQDSLGPNLKGKANDCGFYVGNLKKLDSRYLCTKCHLLLRDPMQGDCGHRYCKNCVQLAHSEAQSRGGQEYLCKLCEEEENGSYVISPDRTYPDNALKREINKNLKVQCPNSPCEFTALIAEVLAHAAGDCEFKPQQCHLCSQEVPASVLTSGQHEKNDCPKRLVPCPDCKLELHADSLEDHRARDCVGVTTKCSYCLARVRDEKKAMDGHLLLECRVGWHAEKPCPYGCAVAKVPESAFEFEKHRESHQATHLDVVMALKLKGHGAASQQQSAAPASEPHQMPSQSPVIAATASVAAPVAPDAHPRLDYDKLVSLRERMAQTELRLLDHPAAAPAARLKEEQQTKAREILEQLQIAMAQGGKVSELVGAIKKQLETCCEEMRQHEINYQKSMERQVDFERKGQEMTKLLAYQEFRLKDLQRRAELLEHGNFDGCLVWRITNVKRRIDEAKNGKTLFFNSPHFFTSKTGYKMCGRIYLNGYGSGKYTHVSLYFFIVRGEYDALLPWPFVQRVTITMIDQSFENHIVVSLKPDPKSASFSRRPSSEINMPSGFPNFVTLSDFERFIKDDTVFVKYVVDNNDLPV